LVKLILGGTVVGVGEGVDVMVGVFVGVLVGPLLPHVGAGVAR